MADDYQQVEFHKFHKVEPMTVSNARSLVGVPCLECKEACPGFGNHSWRAGCSNCNCALWKHDIPPKSIDHPFHRLGLDETLPPLISEYDKASTEGYMWVPRGLRSSQIDSYMRHFEKNVVPKVNTDGAKRRARDIMYQLPVQDYHSESANFLKDDSKNAFFELGKIRMDAVGVGAVRGALSTATKCTACEETINPGRMGVFAEKFGNQYCWHPQCFRCCVDGSVLVDLIYFAHENKLYCGRHWLEQIKPRCHGCEEVIYVGEYTKAMDKSWHTDHFCCRQCDQHLTGQKYIVITHQPYCQQCYTTSIANTCFACNNIIGPESKDMFVKSRHYHRECLTCVQCKKLLESQTFSFINDNPVCHHCRGVDPEKSKFCHSCKEDFHSEEKKVSVNEEYYHEKCFLCSQCENPIGSQKFIRKSDGRRLCNDCFNLSAKNCTKCQTLIKGSTVKFEGNAYHTNCFICTNCSKQLGGIQFYKNEADPFCEECYLSTHAKRCSACYEPIEGNTKFIDYDRKYWHSKCFVCSKCEKALAGSKFIIRDGNRLCLDCK